jgi:hypothetical protein
MNIIKKPDTLSLAGNLNNFELSGIASDVNFTLSSSEGLIIDEIYSPDSNGNVCISIKDIVNELLHVVVPSLSTQSYIQNKAVKQFTAQINTSTHIFTVVKGGVANISESASEFLKLNFLTWQPQVKEITSRSIEFLSYYSQLTCSLKIKAYFADDSNELKSLSLQIGKHYSFNLSLDIVNAYFTKKACYYDVWIESNVRLTYIQRYILVNKPKHSNIYLFENSLGSFDSILCKGELEKKPRTESSLGRILDETISIDESLTVEYLQNTGYLSSADEADWIKELFSSSQRYHYTDSLKKIYLKESNNTYIEDQLNNFKFSFYGCEDEYYQKQNRNNESIPPFLNYNSELFFLNRRLAELLTLGINSEVFIPGQILGSDSWGKISVSSLLNSILSKIVFNPGLNETELQAYLDKAKYATQEWVRNQNYGSGDVDLSTVWTKTEVPNLSKLTIDAQGNLIVPGNIIAFGSDDYVHDMIAAMPVASTTSKGIAQFSNQFDIVNGIVSVKSAVVGLDESALESYLNSKAYATQAWVNSKNYLTTHQSLANYSVIGHTHSYDTLTGKPTLNISNWNTAYSRMGKVVYEGDGHWYDLYIKNNTGGLSSHYIGYLCNGITYKLRAGYADNANLLDNHDSSYFAKVGGDNNQNFSTNILSAKGGITVGTGKWINFYGNTPDYPSPMVGFNWHLGSDGAKMYCFQPGKDQLDYVFQIEDNEGTSDRFVFKVHEWRGYDKEYLVIDGVKTQINQRLDALNEVRIGRSGSVQLQTSLRGIEIKGDLYVDGNVIAYADNNYVQNIIDSMPLASNTSKGIAQFSNQFNVADGIVSINGDISGGLNIPELASYLLTNGYATETFVTSRNYLTSHQSLSHLALKSEIQINTWRSISNAIDSTSTSISASLLAVKTAYDKANHSHPYAALSHAHSQYLTSHQSLTHLALKSEIQINTWRSISNAIDSTSTSISASLLAVKTAYDKANHSHPYAALSHFHSQYLTTHQSLSNYLKLVDEGGTWWQKISIIDTADKNVHRFSFNERQGSGDYIELFGVDGNGNGYVKGMKLATLSYVASSYYKKSTIPNLEKLTIDAQGNLLVPGNVIAFADSDYMQSIIDAQGNLLVPGTLKIGTAVGHFSGDESYTKFSSGNFCITTDVPNFYSYAKKTYHGDSSGCTQLFRGNNLLGNDWSINPVGLIKAKRFSVGYNWGGKTSGYHIGIDGILSGLSFYDGITPYSASIFRDPDKNLYIGVRSGVKNNGLIMDELGNVSSFRKITSTSDMRLKQFKQPLGSVLEKLDNLQTFYYGWKDKTQYDSETHLGLSAQAVNSFFPDFVVRGSVWSLDYARLGAVVAVKGLQEVKVWMSAKDRKILELENRVKKLEKLNIDAA